MDSQRFWGVLFLFKLLVKVGMLFLVRRRPEFKDPCIFLIGLSILTRYFVGELKVVDQLSQADILIKGMIIGLYELLIIFNINNLYIKTLYQWTLVITNIILVNSSEIRTSTYFDLGLLSLILPISFYCIESVLKQAFRAQYETNKELNHFKNILERDLPESIVVLNKKMSKILFFNRKTEQAFNTADKDVLFDRLNDLVLTENPSNSFFLQRIQEEFASANPSNEIGEELPRLPVKLYGKLCCHSLELDGAETLNSQENSFEIRVICTQWESEQAFFILLNDITEKEQLAKLQDADARKDRVLATVSHELRTPLNGVLGMLFLIEKNTQEPEVKELVHYCSNTSKYLLSVINSILDLGQIRNNSIKLTLTRFSLDSLLQEVKNIMEFQAQQRGVEFVITKKTGIPETYLTDENRLKQILINLIGNAIKFTFKGRVELSVAYVVEEPCSKLVVEVNDTGIGIPSDKIHGLFRMYGRIDDQRSINLNKEGVGLGLTISNNLVKMLNENEQGISVISEVNKGSSFSFSLLEKTSGEETGLKLSSLTDHSTSGLTANGRGCTQMPSLNALKIPRRQSSSKPRDRILSATSLDDMIMVPSEKGSRILVVDDNSFNLMIVERFMKNLGLRYERALNGREAVDRVVESDKDRDPFDLILMDMQMPVMDGIEATRTIIQLVQEEKISDVLIVGLTANDSSLSKEEGLKAGMADYMIKPLTEDKLKTILNNMIGTKFAI